MKVNLTSTEIGLIQYVCECIAFGDKIDLDDNGVKIANRISEISSNLLMSEDNQVKVSELPVEDTSPIKYVVERTYKN